MSRLTSGISIALLTLFLFSRSVPGQENILILDKNMAPWHMVATTAEPWVKNGCTVSYRQFYPYLVREDIQKYDIILILGGATPYLPSASLTRGDVDLLKEFLQAGNGVILGYPVFRGELGKSDRHIMNQLLKEVQAKIWIGETVLADSENYYKTTAGRITRAQKRTDWPFSKSGKLAIGSLTPLKIEQDARVEIFAESSPQANFRKGRNIFRGPFPVGAMLLQGGPLLLLSNGALNNSGAWIEATNKPLWADSLQTSSTDFIQRVAKRFLDIKNGASIQISAATATSAIPIAVMSDIPTIPVKQQVPSLSLFPVQTFQFDDTHFPPANMLQLARDAWLQEQGQAGQANLKIIKGHFAAIRKDDRVISPAKTMDELKRLITFSTTAGFSSIMSISNPMQPQTPAPALQLEIDFLKASDKSLQWSPGISFNNSGALQTRITGYDGIIREGIQALDRTFWLQHLLAPISQFSQLIDAHPERSTGIFLELDNFGNHIPATQLVAHEIGGTTFSFFIEASKGLITPELTMRAANIGDADKFHFLLNHGLLPLFNHILEDEMEKLGATLRRKMPAIKTWTLSLRSLPWNWYTRGLLKGLSRKGSPALILTEETDVLKYLNWLMDDEIYLRHAFPITWWTLDKAQLSNLLNVKKAGHTGFWMRGISALLQQEGVQVDGSTITLEELALLIKGS